MDFKNKFTSLKKVIKLLKNAIPRQDMIEINTVQLKKIEIKKKLDSVFTGKKKIYSIPRGGISHLQNAQLKCSQLPTVYSFAKRSSTTKRNTAPGVTWLMIWKIWKFSSFTSVIAGNCLITTSQEGKYPDFVAFANFHSVNIPSWLTLNCLHGSC